MKKIKIQKKDSQSFEIIENTNQEIAIIGMAARGPGFHNLVEFWECLKHGRDCVGPLPDDRKRQIKQFIQYKQIDESGLEFSQKGYINRIDLFDPKYFNLSPEEARLMDPNQRIFLETACYAVQDAGYKMTSFSGKRAGIFLGYSSKNEYLHLLTETEELPPAAIPANNDTIIASRIAHLFDWQGPSLLINTTCSSSLVAVHMACQEILNGECNVCLVGSVNLFMNPLKRKIKIGVESSSERAKTFDDSSDGTGDGEGSFAILLKPLNRALEDNDQIYAIIKSGAVNQDGTSAGLTVPNPSAQSKAIISAWEKAGVNPETITYIEAHGTGTKLGDPIEIDGITKAFRQFTSKKQFCAVGSIKSNIGHLDHAAGIAGLVKAVLCLKYKSIPPTLHFSRPNRKIPFDQSPVYINDKLQNWQPNGIRRCGISSFGISGTNSHLVIEEFEDNRKPAIMQENIFIISLFSYERLKNKMEFILTALQKTDDEYFHNICYTNNIIQEIEEPYKLIIRCKSLSDLKVKISIAIQDMSSIHQDIWYSQNKESWKSSNIDALDETIIDILKGNYIDWCKFYQNNIFKKSFPVEMFTRKSYWLSKEVKFARQFRHCLIWKEDITQNNILQDKGIQAVLLPEKNIPQKWKEEIVNRYERTCSVKSYAELKGAVKEYKNTVVTDIIIILKEKQSKSHIHSFRKGITDLCDLYKGELKCYILCEGICMVDKYRSSEHLYNSQIIGLVQVIEKEYPNIKFKIIDFDDTTEYARIIQQEMRSDNMDVRIAYRKNKRYIQQLSPCSSAINDFNIIKSSTYVISGGTGGLGLEFGKYLASKGARKIVLISSGKSEMNHEIKDSKKHKQRLSAITEMKSYGAEVLVCKADVRNKIEMQKVFAEHNIKKTIRGVIHAAGVPCGRYLAEMNDDYFNEIADVKIQGVNVLNDICNDVELDFFVNCSSVSSLLGGIGQGAYAAANAYLDIFSRNRNFGGKRTISINWATWKETGMAYDLNAIDQEALFKPIYTFDAIAAFSEILHSNDVQVIVGELNSTENREATIRTVNEVNNPQKDTALEGRITEQYTITERKIANAWGQALGYDKFHIDDNFYQIGGDSLTALKVFRVLKDQQFKIVITDVLTYLTIPQLASYLDNQGELLKKEEKKDIDSEYYPTSIEQKRLFFINNIEKAGISYNVTSVIKIEGHLDVNKLKETINKLIKRHEILRTSIEFINGNLVQRIHDEVDIQVNEYVIDDNERDFLDNIITPFDMKSFPLFKVSYILITQKPYDLLVIDMSHIISDGISLTIFLEELSYLYEGHVLADINSQYKDFAIKQEEYLSNGLLNESKQYWMELHQKAIQPLLLPYDYPKTDYKSFKGEKVDFHLTKELSDKIIRYAREQNITAFMFFSTCLSILIHRYTKQEDIVIGTPVSGRMDAKFERCIGMFVNPIALRFYPVPEKNIQEYILETRSHILTAYKYQDYPFAQLIADLDFKSAVGSNTLFDISLLYQDLGEQNIASGQSAIFSEYDYKRNIARNDILIEINYDSVFFGVFEYRNDLFKIETIKNMADRFLQLIAIVIENSGKRIMDLPILQKGFESEAINLFNEDIEE